jgi:magnesium-transporting ATPase (P-type)
MEVAWTKSTKHVLQDLETNEITGLNNNQVFKKQSKYGLNGI